MFIALRVFLQSIDAHCNSAGTAFFRLASSDNVFKVCLFLSPEVETRSVPVLARKFMNVLSWMITLFKLLKEFLSAYDSLLYSYTAGFKQMM